MSQPFLVLDCHYLCHRAFHAQGSLEWNGKATGVIFGFLKSISQMKDEFRTDRIAFCFEGSSLARKVLYPDYKAKRNHKKFTPEEKKNYDTLGVQITELHRRYLPKIGFKNIFCYPHLESDDIMAAIALRAAPFEEIILVTADSDLFQVLRPNVSIYSPQKQKIFTEHWFQKEYGIAPSEWAKVKAISGCKSDNVRGIEGIGEITALRFLRGELKETSTQYQKIMSKVGKFIIRFNRKLVQLPFESCPVPVFREDQISIEGWKEVCQTLGMRSISGRPPLSSKGIVKHAKGK